jgi:hypothetical protein
MLELSYIVALIGEGELGKREGESLRRDATQL